MSLSIKALIFLMTANFNMHEGNSVINELMIDDINFVIPSTYKLNVAETATNNNVLFVKTALLGVVSVITSQIKIKPIDECSIYCSTNTIPKIFKLEDESTFNSYQFIKWKVLNSSNIDNKNIKVGVIRLKKFVIIIIDDEVVWDDWVSLVKKSN
ncbi:hypothetical protein [Thalassotalea agarivorans]|nr:hypothetical protein [Thalassotalea agarivorans]